MIRDMEAQLNCRLFDRTTRRVSPTQAGLRLRPAVERMLAELDMASKQLNELTADTANSVSIAATPFVCADILPKVLTELRQKYPHIVVIIKDVERTAIEPMVEAGEVELGLGILFGNTSGIARRAVAKVGLVAVGLRWRSCVRGCHCLKLAAVDGDHRLREQLQVLAQNNELPADFSDRRAAVSTEARHRFKLRRDTPRHHITCTFRWHSRSNFGWKPAGSNSRRCRS